MQKPAEYFRKLVQSTPHELHFWSLVSERTGTPDSRIAKMRGTLQYFGQLDKLDDLYSKQEAAPSTAALSPSLCGLLEQLSDDLEEYVQEEHLADYRRTYFGMLSLRSVDGCCINQTLSGEPLDGYLILINEGLWVCLQLLAKAFVLENLSGDLAQYKKSGRGDFDAAISHFLSPTSNSAAKVFFTEVPAELEGEMSAAQSSMAILLMQFVVLHELGHVIHRDLELLGAYRIHIGKSDEVVPREAGKHWQAEFAADRYALSTICLKSRSNLSGWANFLTIYVFFSWLSSVERVAGRPLCPLHPAPSSRADALLTYMRSTYTVTEEIDQYIDITKSILADWSTFERSI